MFQHKLCQSIFEFSCLAQKLVREENWPNKYPHLAFFTYFCLSWFVLQFYSSPSNCFVSLFCHFSIQWIASNISFILFASKLTCLCPSFSSPSWWGTLGSRWCRCRRRPPRWSCPAAPPLSGSAPATSSPDTCSHDLLIKIYSLIQIPDWLSRGKPFVWKVVTHHCLAKPFVISPAYFFQNGYNYTLNHWIVFSMFECSVIWWDWIFQFDVIWIF